MNQTKIIDAKARLAAVEICKDFTYTQISQALGNQSAEIWHCQGPDMDHAHDLVITRMGIASFGDMDPLVFTVGSAYGLKFLAGDNVSYRLYNKLDSKFKQEDVDQPDLMLSFAGLLAQHLKSRCNEDNIPDGIIKDAVSRLESATLENAPACIAMLLKVLRTQEAHLCSAFRLVNRHHTGLDDWSEQIEDLFDALKGQNNIEHATLAIRESELNDLFVEASFEMPTTPNLSVLTRLHVLNIGAQRILEIQAAKQAPVQPAATEITVEVQYPRPAGG